MYDEKYELNFKMILNAILRFKRIGIVVGLSVMSLLVFGNKLIFPDQYEATALVQVRMNDILDQQGHRGIRIVQEEILSRTVLETVARELGMDIIPSENKTPIQTLVEKFTGKETALRPQTMDNIVRDLRSGVQITETVGNTGGTSVFSVRMHSKYPEEASKVVNAIVDTYIRQKTSRKKHDAEEAVEFLTVQVDEKGIELVQNARKIEDFKSTFGQYIVEEGSLQSSLQAARLQLIGAEGRVSESKSLSNDIRATLAMVPPTISMPTGAVASTTEREHMPVDPQARLEYLQQLRASYSVQYTDNHPDVIWVNREIDRLNREDGFHGNRRVDGIPAVINNSNPEYTRLRSELATANAEGISAAAEIQMIKAEIKMLEDVLNKAPTVKQQLASLVTNQDTLVSAHDKLESRLAEARLNLQAALTDIGSNYQVVDPAITPKSPMVRSRLILHLFGLVAGTAAAIGIALLLGLVFPNAGRERSSVAGRAIFYVSASAVTFVILSYIAIDFIKQMVEFV